MAGEQGVAQYLNYRRLVAPGVIELHDGALLTAFAYAGPDQEYEEHDRMAAFADHLQQDLERFGNGWMFEVTSLRTPVTLPVRSHHCPDPTSALIAEERARRYAAEGTHYETRHVLTVTYLPPGAVRRQFSEYFFAEQRRGPGLSRAELLRLFVAHTEELVVALRRALGMQRLDDDKLIHFLRYCVTHEDRPVGLPPAKDQLEYVIGSVPIAPHDGELGEQHVKVVGITGFAQHGTHPQMFAELLAVPFALRMSMRFIFLDPIPATKLLRDKEADWGQLNTYNPKRVVFSVLRNIFGSDPDDTHVVAENSDAEEQRDSVGREITRVQSRSVHAGYYTATVVVADRDPAVVQQSANEVIARLHRLGFSAMVETDHAADALGGSWPGHGTRNVRKPLLNTQHFSQLWPTSTQWRGSSTAPCSYYPPASGPLLITTTAGSTPFFLNVHAHNVGNFLIVGPSGHGKTFLLNALALAFRQYQGAQVNLFDRDAGAIVPTLACGGDFFDLETQSYAPLASIESDEERGWASQFCERLAILRGFPMTPQARVDIERALLALSTSAPHFRTLTHFLGQLQTDEAGLREALSFYTIGYAGALLDGVPGPQQDNSFLTFEMEKLLGQGQELSTPVLAYLFHRIQQRLDGRPTLTLVEEGWQAAADTLFQAWTEETSATNRKKVNALGLVLHSPANLAAFARRDLLLTNISTIIFLPNDRANTDGELGQKRHYQALGLGMREIKMLAEDMRPQRDYLCVQGKQRRIFQLESGPLETALLSVNGRDVKQHVTALRAQFGQDWVEVWLRERGLNPQQVQEAA
jgi:type IV secretion/conjugal transfer VirB4 family ATPase